MGCIASKDDESQPVEQPKFSWDRDDLPDPKDYTIANQNDTECGRKPGTINGQQFIIENCVNTKIYLFDYSAMVTVDNCENCVLIIGPCKGSVFLRNCKNCQVLVACQQLRTRDCRKIDLHLLCATQPIIESSASVKFGCFQLYYPELIAQFEKSGLSVYNNTWSVIHDFTPLEDGYNWSLISNSKSIESNIPKPSIEELQSVATSFDKEQSIVPLTRGKLTSRFDDSCLLVLFADVKSNCKEFLMKLNENNDSYDIRQTKEIAMSSEDATRVFKSEKYDQLAKQGPVIALELNGENIIRLCEDRLEQLGISLSSIFISKNANTAKADIDAFYNFVDMTLGV